MNISENTFKAVAKEWLLDAVLNGESEAVIDYLCEKADKARIIKKKAKGSNKPVVSTKLLSCIAIAEDRSQCGNIVYGGTNYCADHLKTKGRYQPNISERKNR
jgi:hypothetical protein